MKLWEPGQGIVLREVWRGRVYSIIPVRVAQDMSLENQWRELWTS